MGGCRSSLIFYLVTIIGLSLFINNTYARAEGEEMKGNVDSVQSVSPAELDLLRKKIIYFGHQSVGYNIVDGIKDVLGDVNMPNLIVEDIGDNKLILSDEGFIHSRIGVNNFPYKKIDGFKNIVEANYSKIDVAILKFCYQDIDKHTDVDMLFGKYREALKNLKGNFPLITFIHVTVPLRTVQSGPKAWLKKLINKPLGGYADNIQRNRYNEKLLNEYGEIEPIFDIAKVESTYPTGRDNFFLYEGLRYRSLIPDYSNDGKHLNKYGRDIVARELLLLLSNLF